MENNQSSSEEINQIQSEMIEKEGLDLHVDWKAPITTVTPLSRTLAWILIIFLPILGFLLGSKYAGEISSYHFDNDYHVPLEVETKVGEKKEKTEEGVQKHQEADETGVSFQSIKDTVKANNKFAIDFYKKLSSEEEGNLFFSPYSISTALAMTYEGTRGKTAEEISNVFGFSSDSSVRRPAMASIYNLINKDNSLYSLYTANALWVQKDYQLLPEFTDIVSKYYGGYATNVDFVGEMDKSITTINDWVAKNTNNKIKDLFEKGSLDSSTRLVLTNTIYFKGDWLEQFDSKLTRNDSFNVTSNEKVQTPMMQRTVEDAEYPYLETDSLQILELPYKGEELSMLVLLPSSIDGLSGLEAELTTENIDSWVNGLEEQRVDVYLPKFKLETKYNLNKTLSILGMPMAFDADLADFSGMSGLKDLSIGLVLHQAFVEVNEEGTEAAAATAVAMKLTSVMPIEAPVFRADHPFLFLIKENKTGDILFMGRVTNPTK